VIESVQAVDSSSRLGIEQQVEATVSWMNAVGLKTVLCVDDEKIGLRVRKIMLESHGFKVLTASSGVQGLTIFDDQPVDLVVLDYYMPGLNGGDVAAEMRRRRPDVPIIFLSAYFSLPPDALELANAFITKGDPPDVLIKKIKQLVSPSSLTT
jgi:CheY-like chemotaxis protein